METLWLCITSQADSPSFPFSLQVLDVGDLVVMPGIIDPHIHACEPGHTVLESYSSATKAAAAGGITTIVDMPMYGTRERGKSMLIPFLVHGKVMAGAEGTIHT